MDLRTATSSLLRDPKVATWLKLADSYIQAYNRMPKQFVLPAEHSMLKPVIEAFAYDTDAFAQYIRALRDAADGTAYDELHELYRMVSMRALQNERRARIRKGLLLLFPHMAAALGREPTYDEQMRIARFIEQRWGAMRIEFLASERRLYKTRRLSSEERNISLKRFWKSLDDALEKGEVPLDTPLSEVLKLVTEA